jgi:voltage-gated potassium channel
MTDSDLGPGAGRPSLIDRRVRRIANARSVTVGLALTFVALALVGAIVIRIADAQNFPSLGLAVWWALQTVTTVGYGDVVPTTNAGRLVGGVEMVIGVSFIAFLTAGVTSTVVQRGQAGAAEAERMREARDLQTIVDALAQITHAITDLDKRLDNIESTLGS